MTLRRMTLRSCIILLNKIHLFPYLSMELDTFFLQVEDEFIVFPNFFYLSLFLQFLFLASLGKKYKIVKNCKKKLQKILKRFKRGKALNVRGEKEILHYEVDGIADGKICLPKVFSSSSPKAIFFF